MHRALPTLSPEERMRLGLRYVRGLRESAGKAIVRERLLRPFAGIQELARRVPDLRADEMERLAADFSPESVAGVCGIEAERIRRTARDLAVAGAYGYARPIGSAIRTFSDFEHGLVRFGTIADASG